MLICGRPVFIPQIPKAPFAGCVYKTTLTTTTDENGTTWNSQDIGAPHPSRIVVLAVFQGVNGDLTTVTVNGINEYHKTRLNEFSITAHRVPTDTTATIVVTAATSLRKAVGVYVGYPWNPIPLDFGSVSANTTTDANVADQKTQAGGFLIYSGGQLSTLGTFTTTWNGQGSDAVTENADAQLEATSSYTNGHINITRSDDIGDVNMAESTSGTKRLIVCSWGPPWNYVS